MGSWKTTCAVTSAPISSGQPVRLFFIASDRMKYRASAERSTISKGSISYTYNDFKIIGGMGIKAFYSNMGRYVFDEKNMVAEHIIEEIKNAYVPNPENLDKENFYDDFINIPAEKLDFKTIQRMIEEGDLYIKSYNPGVLNFVSVMAIHESIYQMMINEGTTHYIPKINDYKTKFLQDVFNEEWDNYLIWKDNIEKQSHGYLDLFIKKDEVSDEQNMIKAKKKALYSAMTMNKFGQDYERHYVFRGQDHLVSFLNLYHKYPGETEESVVFKIIEARLFSRKLEEHNIMIRPTMTSCETKNIDDTIQFYKEMIVSLEKIADTEFEIIDEEDEDY